MSKSKNNASPLERFRNKIRGSRSPLVTLAEGRNKVPLEYIPELVAWLPNVVQDGRRVFPSLFPSRIADLRTQPILPAADLKREIVWAGSMFALNSVRINSFLLRAKEYDNELLNGNYLKCCHLLDLIEKDYGFSLWTIENRVALLQQAEGLERQKAYAQTVKEARRQNDSVAYITFCISYRNEDTVTREHFISQVIDNFDRIKMDGSFKTYLLFRIADVKPGDDESISAILRYEATSSVIDYYETFIGLCKYRILQRPLALRQPFISEISRIVRKIDDIRLHKLLFLSGKRVEIEGVSKLDTELLDFVVKGRYAEALTHLESPGRNSNPSELLLEGELRAEDGLVARPIGSCLGPRLVNLGLSVVAKSDDMYESVSALNKLALNFRLTRFGTSLDAFCSEHLSSAALPTESEISKSAFVDSDHLMVRILRHLGPSDVQKKYTDLVLKAYGPTPACYFEILRSGLDIPSRLTTQSEDLALIDPDLKAEMLVERALAGGSHAEALALSDQLCSAGRLRARRNGARFKAYALLKLGKSEELVDFIVKVYLADKAMVRMLPIKECAKTLNKQIRAALKKNLSAPILLDLYSRYISDDLDNLRAFAYEDFLKANGMNRPSELEDRLPEYAPEKIIYYMKNICIPSIMRVSTAFTSTRDLEDERLSVLGILIKADPVNSTTYEGEAHEITRSQMIRRAVRHVEQSKISIDLPAMGRWADKNIKESFNRYKGLLKAGMSGEGESVLEALKGVIIDVSSPQETPELPKNEALDVLSSTLFLFFRECTSNPEHGLDCYLSIRVRHGTLSGQLRSPLEKNNIIAQRESGSNEYKSNLFWMKNLQHIEPSVREAIDACLKVFARSYDDLIDKIANELIQVRSDEKKSGLFEITEESGGRARVLGVGLREFTKFVLAVKEDTTFESFLDLCLNLFWESVEGCLENVREMIDTSLKIELNDLFARVEKDLADIAGYATISDLIQSIRTAKTEAQEALDRVKDWFRLSKPLATTPFSFQDLVDIGLQYVKKLHPDFAPVITQDLPTIPLIEGGLDKFPDIFIIVFDNIRRHSGITEHPAVEISLQDLQDKLCITIQNEVGHGVRILENKEKVQRIKEAIISGANKSALRSEGGTGFIKLKKLIRSSEETSSGLDFGFGQDERFYVKLDVPIVHVTEVTT